MKARDFSMVVDATRFGGCIIYTIRGRGAAWPLLPLMKLSLQNIVNCHTCVTRWITLAWRRGLFRCTDMGILAIHGQQIVALVLQYGFDLCTCMAIEKIVLYADTHRHTHTHT